MLFTKKTTTETSTFLDARNAILSELAITDPGTEQYEKLLHELERVQVLITKNPTWSFKPSADVIVTSFITLFVTIAVIKHEEVNVITSKAMGFLPKLMK